MHPEQNLIDRLNSLFHPESVAVVGVPRGMKSGKLFLMALQDQGFPGRILPVHPEAGEIDGLTAYPSVSAIPGPVDLAIVLVSRDQTLPVVRECAAKGVKGVVLFTAGYRETGAQGEALEQELLQVARSAGTRLIGPNCMGLYCPESGLSFFPELSRESGPVGLISHSGSLANIICRMGSEKGLLFSKVASLGNECDLTSRDFLLYLGNDPATRVIGGYLEGIKNGRRFLETLREVSLSKPVILWKVGLTPEGMRAASSHTGAMAGSRNVWLGVVRQGGAVPVAGFEAWVDALMTFSMLPADPGHRIAIVSGPGGLAVSAAEACGGEGLALAELSPETRSHLSRFVPPTGTSLRNPVDVGLSASFEMDIYAEAVRTVAMDPGVDAVAVIGRGMSDDLNHRYLEALIRARREAGKPILVVNIPGFDASMPKRFFEAGLPFYESAERAMRNYAMALKYRQWQKKHAGR